MHRTQYIENSVGEQVQFRVELSKKDGKPQAMGVMLLADGGGDPTEQELHADLMNADFVDDGGEGGPAMKRVKT